MELVMLAHTYKGKPLPDGTLMSEKLDGLRANWIPGTKGFPAKMFPFAHMLCEKNPDAIISTGLWSRGGKVINAPKWWLDKLPNFNIDGELWVRRQGQNLIESIAMGGKEKVENDPRWSQVKYMIYGSPAPEFLYLPRKIKVRNELICDIGDWDRVPKEIRYASKSVNPNIYNHQMLLAQIAKEFPVLNPDTIELNTECGPFALQQYSNKDMDRVEFLDRVLRDGGEGVVYILPGAMWEPERSHKILKDKPFSDDEGIIIGFTGGRDDNLGKVGAIRLQYGDKQFDLSGITQAERELEPECVELAKCAPGKFEPLLRAKQFKIGQTITFKYRELTPYGIPKEARYWREKSRGH